MKPGKLIKKIAGATKMAYIQVTSKEENPPMKLIGRDINAVQTGSLISGGPVFLRISSCAVVSVRNL